MLINSVILFLQDALPVFLITALLLLRFIGLTNQQGLTSYLGQLRHKKWLYQAIIFALVMIFILTKNMAVITQKFSGMGAEVIFSVAELVVYLCCTVIFIVDMKNSNNNWPNNQRLKEKLALVILFMVLSLNGTHFNIYLNGFWAQTEQLESLVIGMILGAGICISIAILLYFTLQYCDENICVNTSRYILLFFAVGQLIQATSLLEQVDLLPNGQIVWNSQQLLSENSELGYLLTALFGYEATPSTMQLALYSIALLIPIIIARFLAKKNRRYYLRDNNQDVLLSTARKKGDL
ncbi:MAG: hypothetical protein COB83_09170 [Gammaproteobacteria bacterium]|nr:MAG: hypothetical protein COB83_09170 [Gammaproteobacteria bacterium]